MKRFLLPLLFCLALSAFGFVNCSAQIQNRKCKKALKQNVSIDEYVKSYDVYVPL